MAANRARAAAVDSPQRNRSIGHLQGRGRRSSHRTLDSDGVQRLWTFEVQAGGPDGTAGTFGPVTRLSDRSKMFTAINSWRFEIMQAHQGDELIVRGHRTGQPDRTGQVLEARGQGDTQPFLVRWDDNGHTTLFYPGTDCVVRELTGKKDM